MIKAYTIWRMGRDRFALVRHKRAPAIDSYVHFRGIRHRVIGTQHETDGTFTGWVIVE